MTPQELKNSILQLAIQGKLVEQRPEEGTAQELYAQIQAEKQRLIKEGKIKKEKPLPEITEEEKPFEIPEGWMWVRLREITCLNPKNDLPDELEVSFIPMALIDDGYRSSHSFEIKTWGSIKKGFTHFADGDIGIAKITPCFQNRKSVIFCNLKNGYGAGTTELSIVRVVNDLLSRNFLLYFFKSAYFIENGVKSFTGTAGQQRIHKDYLATCVLPLPPLAEQKRIVAKIEELLPLVDRYEQAWTKLEDFNRRFPEDMKKSILQQAIQGKLVEQRPEEGTAQELYAQIQAEKQRLVKEGKIKKEKPLPEIMEEEKPFEIPEGWMWCRLNDISWYLDAGKSPKCDKQPVNNNEWGVITTTAIQSGQFDETQNKILPYDFAVNTNMQIHKGDILITRAGPTNRTGVACVVKSIQYNLILSDKTVRINTTNNFLCKDYIVMALNSPQIRLLILELMSGMDKQQVNISQDKYKTLVLPLPPLAEQKRIVERVEELLAMCERLK